MKSSSWGGHKQQLKQLHMGSSSVRPSTGGSKRDATCLRLLRRGLAVLLLAAVAVLVSDIPLPSPGGAARRAAGAAASHRPPADEHQYEAETTTILGEDLLQTPRRLSSLETGPSFSAGGRLVLTVEKDEEESAPSDIEQPGPSDLLAPLAAPEVPQTEEEYLAAAPGGLSAFGVLPLLELPAGGGAGAISAPKQVPRLDLEPVFDLQQEPKRRPAPPKRLLPLPPPKKRLKPCAPKDFRRIAKAAAKGPEKTVIISCVNEGYLRFFKNWVSFLTKLGLTDRLLVFSDDAVTHRYVEARWPGHSVFQVPVPELRSFKGAGSAFHMFGSRDFFEFAKRRPFYITSLLKLHLSVLYSDLDTAWLHSPFPYFKPGFDFFIQDDTRWQSPSRSFNKLTKLVNYRGQKNLCSCFLFFRPTYQSLGITKQWGHFMKTTIYTGYGADQPRLNRAINRAFRARGRIRPPTIGLLPLPMFPPGWLYFTKNGWRDRWNDKITVVHNNWIKGSSACKVRRFKEAGLWLVEDEEPARRDPNLRCEIWGQSWYFNGSDAKHVTIPHS